MYLKNISSYKSQDARHSQAIMSSVEYQSVDFVKCRYNIVVYEIWINIIKVLVYTFNTEYFFD